MRTAAQQSVAALTGLVLALALGIGRLTRPEVILGWVDVFGQWDPTLLWFMAGATPMYALAHRWVLARGAPVLACELSLPAQTAVDAKLLSGSALFGAGWAIGGVCPGPALTSLGAGAPWALPFVVAMFLGLWLAAPRRLQHVIDFFVQTTSNAWRTVSCMQASRKPTRIDTRAPSQLPSEHAGTSTRT